MDQSRPLWLVTNDMSGSNDERALELIRESCEGHGLRVAHRSSFPVEDPPTPEMLDAGGIDLVAIFAGDGTINATIDQLAGWGGEVLILPGGTMNLLHRRLFGDLDMEATIQAVCAGDTHAVRPNVIRSDDATAYAGLLAGPGTTWNGVREAMRETAVIELAEEAVHAIESTLGDAGVACVEPELGRREGYPLILLNPVAEGIEAVAYHAESAGEYLEQTFALMRRDFRQGPHDVLGVSDRIVLGSTDRSEFGILFDGEPKQSAARAEFTVAPCAVDLLATEDDA